MAIVRDFVWSALLGFIGALLVLKGADTFLWNARQTVTKPFQKSYTFENDFDPNSTEPQYNMVTPGVPWSGVWYDSTLEQNTLVETSTCIYTNQGVEGLPRYYMIEPQDDGSQLIVYYYIEDPTSDSAVATVDMVYQLSADQSTMTRFADPALGTGFDVVYTRPEKSSANSLPEELWGYWASDSRGESSSGISLMLFILTCFPGVVMIHPNLTQSFTMTVLVSKKPKKEPSTIFPCNHWIQR